MQAPEYTIPAHGDVGLPSFQTESIGGTPALFYGSKEITTGVEDVAASTTLAAYSVVARDSVTGKLKLAVQGTDDPCGILAHPVTTGVGVTTTATVFKSGSFNANALTWDASYNTDTEKLRAFEGSLAPEIQIGIPQYTPLV